MATVTTLHERRGERVAVLLNANAKSVDEKLRRELSRFVPEGDLYYSRSLTDARQIATTVMDRGYTTLLTGGGDGTFVGYVNEVFGTQVRVPSAHFAASGGAALQMALQPRPMPKFGVLRLGTGNALATMLGSSASPAGVVEDILRARSGDVHTTRTLHLLDAEGKAAPFAGLGLDALVLNDYVAVKKRLEGTPLRALGTGGLGYAMSLASRSVPRTLMQRRLPNVRIVNEGTPAQQIGPDGRPVGRPIEAGEVVYEGPCRIAAAGTVTCYGYGFTIFPHALRAPGRMQLRVTALSIPKILSQVPAIWKGRTPAGILDFHADRVRLDFDQPMPFQIGGDAEGYRESVTLGVDPRTVELLDFKKNA